MCADIHSERDTHTHKETDRQTDRQRQRDRDKQTDSQAENVADTYTIKATNALITQSKEIPSERR